MPVMTFHSILFPGPPPELDTEAQAAKPMYRDLNIDQIIDSVARGREEYDLAPYFYLTLDDADAIGYRHEVLRDLDGTDLFGVVTDFAQDMHRMRARLGPTSKSRYAWQRDRWHLAAVSAYCSAITRLSERLDTASIRSRGFAALRDYVTDYVASRSFTEMMQQTEGLERDLDSLRYSIDIKGNRIRVSNYHDEPDYSVDVASTFEKFKQSDAKDYRVKFTSYDDLDHVEAGVLERVAQLFPEIFGALDQFWNEHREFADAAITGFDREVQVYIAYLDHISPLKAAGLAFCYPEVSSDTKSVRVRETFDLALAAKLVPDDAAVVCNDFHLDDPERILVVSGPNQGGKTTLARTFGQLHYLGSLGLPVPGRDAQLYLCDQILTHFERGENLEDLVGKLQDDLVRIHDIVESATPDSVVIMNEIFNSTALEDALYLSREVLERLIRAESLCVCVTFLDELSSLGPATVSMVSTVEPDDPAVRTYQLVRKPADGRAYAMAIAERYRLTYERLVDRVTS